MQKIKLLFLIDGFNQGGAEAQLYQLVKGLDKSKFHVRVLTWYPSKFYLDLANSEGVEWIEVIRKSKFDFRVLRRALSLIRSGEVDILHTYLDQAGFYGLVCKLFYKNIIFIASERSSFKKLTFLQRIHKPIAHRLANLTVANSSAGAKYLTTLGVGKESIQIIRNGIDTKKFSAGDGSHLIRLQEKFPFLSNLRLALCVGRVTRLKNQLSIVKAYAESAIKDEFALLFIGIPDVAYAAAVQQLIDTEGLGDKVFMLRESSEIQLFYKAAELVVLFSDYEGTPNAVLEAMACSKPIVCSDVGDIRTYVDDTCGWVITKGDTARLTAVFNSIAHMRPQDIARRGNLAHAKFNLLRCDAQNMVKEHEQLYGQLVEKY